MCLLSCQLCVQLNDQQRLKNLEKKLDTPFAFILLLQTPLIYFIQKWFYALTSDRRGFNHCSITRYQNTPL